MTTKKLILICHDAINHRHMSIYSKWTAYYITESIIDTLRKRQRLNGRGQARLGVEAYELDKPNGHHIGMLRYIEDPEEIFFGIEDLFMISPESITWHNVPQEIQDEYRTAYNVR